MALPISYGKKSFKVWAQERPKRMYVSSACIIITVLLNISYAIFRHVYKYLDSQRFTQFKQLKLKLPKNIYREQVHSYLMNFCCVVFVDLANAIVKFQSSLIPSYFRSR